jgi:chromosomal replication initiation ATPase DnaA
MRIGAKTEGEGRRLYEELVDEWMASDRKSPFKDVKLQSYLGSESFGEWLQSKVNTDRELSAEIVGHGEWKTTPDVGAVFRASVEIMGVESADLVKGRRANEARDIVLYLCREESDASLSEIAGMFGVKYATVSMALKRLKEKMVGDDALAERVREIRCELTRRLGGASARGVA